MSLVTELIDRMYIFININCCAYVNFFIFKLLLLFIGDATVLLSMLPSSLHILLQGVYRFPGFPSNTWFLLWNTCFLHQNTVLHWFLCVVLCMVSGGKGGGSLGWLGGILGKCMQFNLPTWFLILDPRPDPVPAGYWGADLRGLSVNRTSQRRLQFVRLPTPVLTKGILPFSLTWLDSIERARLVLPYLSFRPLREQTAKNVSVGFDSAYRACLSWSFPPVQERCHWFILVRICTSVSEFDVSDGVELTIP